MLAQLTVIIAMNAADECGDAKAAHEVESTMSATAVLAARIPSRLLLLCLCVRVRVSKS